MADSREDGAAPPGGDATWKTHQAAFEAYVTYIQGTPRRLIICSKDPSKFYDPCQEAADRSLRCVYRNGGDKSLCHDYFK